MKKTKTRQRIRKGVLLLFFILFPVVLNYLSPYLSMSAASKGIASGSLLFFGLLLLSSLILGRAFCGWICPGGAAQEICLLVNDRRVRCKRLDWIKYVIWVPWLATILLFLIRSGGAPRAEPLYNMNTIVSVDSAPQYIIYYFVLGLIMIPAVAVGRRAMCHSICWMAPFMIFGRKLRNLVRWPALRLKASTEKCVSCDTCTKNCPMSLEVQNMVEKAKMESAECILCGQCVDNCPHGVIRYSFSRGV
ncbi:MAG: 4Fe-4S binding protein [Spirochaetia bacterium]